MTRPIFSSRRRDFLIAGGTCLTGASLASQVIAWSPNDRLQIGVIGLGSRGYNLIDALVGHRDHARIVAICDVDVTHYRDRVWGEGGGNGLIPAGKKIEAAYAKHGIANSKQNISRHRDYRDLLARPEVDAVVVATPDHWHARCTLDAIAAGKDVYCEKPVTHLFSEGQAVCRAVAMRDVVFQTGSQQRSDWRFRRAVELARNGVLGNIHTIKVGQQAGYPEPMGDTKLVKVPKQLDYEFWCGPSPVLPYMRARHHRWWRGHRAYGGGVLMDWIGHHNDIAHWALGIDESGPAEVEAVDWTFPETDVYDTPVQYTIRCRYRGGVTSTISSANTPGLELVGSLGSVYVNRGKLQASDERWAAADFNPGSIKVAASDDHMGNFLQCVRSRQATIATAETGHRSITPGHLGYVSHALGRSLQWDALNERVVNDEAANRLLQVARYREPWD